MTSEKNLDIQLLPEEIKFNPREALIMSTIWQNYGKKEICSHLITKIDVEKVDDSMFCNDYIYELLKKNFSLM